MDIYQIITITQSKLNHIEIADQDGNYIGGADCFNEDELKEVLWDILKPHISKVTRIHSRFMRTARDLTDASSPNYGKSLCGIGHFTDLTADNSRVTCKRCLKILGGKKCPFDCFYIKPDGKGNFICKDCGKIRSLNSFLSGGGTLKEDNTVKTDQTDYVTFNPEEFASETASHQRVETTPKNAYIRFEDCHTDRIGDELGPFEFAQITYNELKVGPDGDVLAFQDEEGYWRLVEAPYDSWPDIIIYFKEK